jgi:RNA polymerase sigma-70 factor (ECF subfamily)
MAEDAPLTVTTDEQLIADTLHGDVSSFGTIVERYWNMIVALALSRIDDPIAAEDIAQESFLKAYIHLRKLRNPGRFAGWLSKIVLQESVNHVRRCSRNAAGSRPASTCLEALNMDLACSTNPGLTESQTSFVRQAISQLPERFQKIIVMRFVADLSAPEIAKQLGKRSGTIRVWLHRAYKILRKDLAPLLEEVEQ